MAKLFNIIVDAVVREWLRIMRKMLNDSDGKLVARIEELFAIFYVDDGYIALRDAELLQEALGILVETFKHVGLATNMKKTQAMVCTPGKIRVQLPTDSYQRLREGVTAGEEWKQATVCHVCKETLQARSLHLHLEHAHDIYQQVVVADNLLAVRPSNCYEAERVGRKEPIRCPFSGCPGKLSSAYMLRRHFRDVHPKDSVIKSRGKAPSHIVNSVQCSATQGTPTTFTRRCAGRGWRVVRRGTWPSSRPWPSGSCSTLKGTSWR